MSASAAGTEGMPRDRFFCWILKGGLPFFLLLAFTLQGLYFSRVTGQTTDETYYNGSGYAMLRYQNYRFSGEHPPLMMQLGSIPLLFLKPKFPIEEPVLLGGEGREIDLSRTGSKFLYKMGNDPEQILRLERLPVLTLAVLTGWILFLWSRHLFGWAGGCLSLTLYAFCPNMIAHGSLFTTDFGVTAFIFMTAFSLYRFMDNPSAGRAVCTGIFAGCALLAKVSALTVVPAIFLVFTAVLIQKQETHNFSARLKFGRFFYAGAFFLLAMSISSKVVMPTLGPLCLIALSAYPCDPPRADLKRWIKGVLLLAGGIAAFIYAARLFEKYETMVALVILAWLTGAASCTVFVLLGRLNPGRKALLCAFLTVGITAAGVIAAGYTDAIRSILHFSPFDHYIRAFNGAIAHARSNHTSCVEGSFVTCDWRYFPALMAVKTPFLTLSAFVVGSLYFASGKTFRALAKLSVLSVPVVFFMVAVFLNQINIGVRHILPVYPFMFLLAGGTAAWAGRLAPGKIRGMVSGLLVLAAVFTAGRTVSLAPHYLSYFSEWVGGAEEGARLVSDSNLDWGQDNRRLAETALQRNLGRIFIDSAVSNADLYDYYGLKWERVDTLAAAVLAPGVYALSVEVVRRHHERPGSFFYQRQPDYKTGETVYFYEIK